MSFRALLSTSTRAKIFGNTDSEYLAALLREQAAGDLAARVRRMLEIVRSTVRHARVSAQLNLVVADGTELVAVRHSVDADAPSLWVRARDDSFSVASEPMECDDGWREAGGGVSLFPTAGAEPGLEQAIISAAMAEETTVIREARRIEELLGNVT